MPLLHLPDDLLELILQYTVDDDWIRTSWHDVLSLRTVCKQIYWPLTRTAFRKLDFDRSDIRFLHKNFNSRLLRRYLYEKCRSTVQSRPYMVSVICEIAKEASAVQQQQHQRLSQDGQVYDFVDHETLQDQFCEAVIAALPRNEIISKLTDRPPKTSSEHRSSMTNIIGFAASTGNIDLLKQTIDMGADVDTKSYLFKTPLRAAIVTGNAATATLLIQAGADPHVLEKGVSLVCLATRLGHQNVVQALLENGASLRMSMENRGVRINELHEAISHHAPLGMIQLLLQHGASIYEQTDSGFMPLELAAITGVHKDVLQFLLDTAVSRGMRRKSLEATLVHAARNGQYAAAEILLEYGFDPNEAVLMHDRTAAHYAAARGDTELLKLLHKYGADFALCDADCRAPLHDAAMSYSDCGETVDYLLSVGAKPNGQEKDGKTPLYGAAERGHIEIVRRLLAYGADVQVRVKSGMTPLLVAAAGYRSGTDSILSARAERKHGTEILKLLIQNGADCRAKNINGEEALHFACQHQNLHTVRTLLDHGADVNAACYKGKTALHVAAECGCLEIVQLLFSRGADLNMKTRAGKTALHFAASSRFSMVVQWLLEQGVPPNQASSIGQTPLYYAVDSGAAESIYFLIDAGADVNAKTIGGESIIMRAVSRGRKTTVQTLLNLGAKPKRSLLEAAKNTYPPEDFIIMLLDAGEDVNSTDSHGRTALHWVVDSRDGGCVTRLLLDRGANVQARDSQGKTPLHLASSLVTIESLVYGGADPFAVDNAGSTALEACSLRLRRRPFFSSMEVEKELSRVIDTWLSGR